MDEQFNRMNANATIWHVSILNITMTM